MESLKDRAKLLCYISNGLVFDEHTCQGQYFVRNLNKLY